MRLKEVALTKGFLNKMLPTMFALRKDRQFVGVMISNVDDLLYGNLSGHEKAMQEILDTFSVREIDSAPYKFRGKEVEYRSHSKGKHR